MIIQVVGFLLLYLPLGYVFAPISLGLLLGFIQKTLFLRGGPPTIRWWPVATGLGSFTGAVVGISFLYLLASVWVKLFPEDTGMGGILFIIILIGGSFGMVGIICSLFQIWFFKGRKALVYLVWAWISSAIAGWAALGGWFLYDMLHAPFSCPVAAEGDMMVFQEPLMLLVAIFVYGIGTSLVLLLLKRQG